MPRPGEHVSHRFCFTQNRRQLLPTSTEHWAVALANFSIGRTLPDIVAAILHRQETSQRVHLAFSRGLHMIRDDYVSHLHHVNDTTVAAHLIGPRMSSKCAFLQAAAEQHWVLARTKPAEQWHRSSRRPSSSWRSWLSSVCAGKEHDRCDWLIRTALDCSQWSFSVSASMSHQRRTRRRSRNFRCLPRLLGPEPYLTRTPLYPTKV